ncbi:hypothetical protein [Streptomyces sp. NPDC057496]|uniref:hypothetical protein n=1 Tax=Streptomyces sp. NPDC057496 TaxID=3346149 RepID=UPI0036C72B91
MAFTYARRAAVVMASVAVAVAGLLATGGSASAAAPVIGDRPATVSRASLPVVGAHHQGEPGHWGEGGFGSHRHAHGDGGHRHWGRDHNGNRHRMNDDDLRRQWVLDQIYWLQDHGTRR